MFCSIDLLIFHYYFRATVQELFLKIVYKIFEKKNSHLKIDSKYLDKHNVRLLNQTNVPYPLRV